MTGPGSSTGRLPSWFGIPFMLGGLLVIGFGIVLLLDEMKFGSEGAVTKGVVVDRLYSPGGGDTGPTFGLQYQFVDPATGAQRYGSSDVSEETYDAANIGDVVDVTYLPRDPTKSRLGTTELQLFVPAMVLGGGALFAVVGLGLLVLVPRLRRRAAESGSFTPAMSVASGPPSDALPDPLAAVFFEPPQPSARAEQRPISDAELRALDAHLAPPPARPDRAD